MTSRLRRLYFINAKTSGATPSGAFTHIDPRGGAAVTGDNGAGKTTSLQLFPLFFGFSANQMFQASGNLEPLLRFVLPTAQSALCFEYQRGDTEADINCAVMRRQHGTDAAEFRFIPGPFNPNYFMEPSHGEDSALFLDDDGTVAAATRLGAAISAKVNASQYRSIILNQKSQNKDGDLVRRLAAQFSFSHTRLPLLDRIVAAVVKKHVDFRDLTAVVVTIVFERMGGFGGGGNESNRTLAVRQGQQQIERWLRNRDACEAAQKAEPEVLSVRQKLMDLRRNTALLGQHRADVRKLSKLLAQRVRDKEAELETMDSDRQCQYEGETEALTALTEASDATHAHFSQVKQQFDDARNAKLHYAEQEAGQWAAQLDRKPVVESEHLAAVRAISAMENEAQGIARQFNDEIQAIKERTQGAKDKLLVSKGAFTQRYDTDISDLQKQETDRAQELRNAQDQQVQDFQDVLGDLKGDLAIAKDRVKAPQLDPELVQRTDDALETQQAHYREIAQSQARLGAAEMAMFVATAAFEETQAAIGCCTAELDQGRKRLADAQALLTPPQGSLHAALEAGHGDEWKATIARVIDPALLSRTDLQPHRLDETPGADDGVYGWGLDLAAIETPAWVNAEAQRAAVEECNRSLTQLEAELGNARAAFEQAAGLRGQADSALGIAKANHQLLTQRTKEIEQAVTQCKGACDSARARLKEEAQAYESTVRQRITEAEFQLSTLRSQHELQRAAIADEFKVAREQARDGRDRAAARVDGEIADLERVAKVRIRQIETDRDQKLQDSGLDVVRLKSEQARRDALRHELDEIEKHAPLAKAYGRWVSDGGPAQVVDLEGKAQRSEVSRDEAKGRLDAHRDSMKETLTRFERNRGLLLSNLKKTSEERDACDQLEAGLEEFTASVSSHISLESTATELKGNVDSARADRIRIQRDLDSLYRRIELALLTTESQVKEFLQRCLDELGAVPATVEKAERLVVAYDRIGREVLAPVNLELNTILGNIGQFRSRIQAFESEVRAFNRSFQEGLTHVVMGFPRLQNLNISVVTDFEKLDFMAKLGALDEVVRHHQMQNRALYAMELPPAATCYALRDFMSVLGSGTIEIDLAQHLTLTGSVSDNGVLKKFHREHELETVSSNGLTAIVLIALLSGLLNVVRGKDPIYIPWSTDEVGKFDPNNFHALMDMLRDNRIDVVTASPSLTPAAYKLFAARYRLGPGGSISVFSGPRQASGGHEPQSEGAAA